MDSYITVGKGAIAEFESKKSRFISEICSVKSEEEALEFIAAKKKEFWNATHNVYAFVLRKGGIQRFSDDGEPGGTAGMPTLDVINGNGLVDCVIVTTRYFGGTLLGTGGLVRSYSKSAALSVDSAEIIKMQLCCHAEVECDYNQYGRLASVIPSEGGIITDTLYTDVVKISFYIAKPAFDGLQKQITEVSSGSLTAEIISEKFEKVTV